MSLDNYRVEKSNIMNYKNMDVLDYIRTLPDRSMDLIILDPPYYKVTKNKWDRQWSTHEEYAEWCREWIYECARVAKYSCSIWLFGYLRNIPPLYCAFEHNNFTFRQQIVVEKGMRAVAGRTKMDQKVYPTTTESIFHFHYEARPYIGELLETQRQVNGLKNRQINRHLGLSTTGGGAYSAYVNKNPEKMVYPKKEHWDKLSQIFELPRYNEMVYTFDLQPGLRDVWRDIDFYSESRIHPTQKPVKLIKRLIETCSKEGMNVLDPFAGSAVTGVVCNLINRNFYGCEISKEYYERSISHLHSTTYNLSNVASI